MKQPRAIVLIYSGEEPPVDLLAAITTNIAVACGTDQVDHFVFDPKNLATAIVLGITEKVKNGEYAKKSASCLTPEDNAAVFIGGFMKNDLADPKKYSQKEFSFHLLQKINEALDEPYNGINIEFLKAVKILSGENLKFSSKEILRDSWLNEERIGIIRDTYNFVKGVRNE
jgi:hypothetical protein